MEARAAAAERAPPRAAASALVFDESGDEAPEALEGAAPIAESSSSSATSSSSEGASSSESDSSTSSSEEHDPLPTGLVPPKRLEGQKVKVEYAAGGAVGLRVRCNCAGHANCGKYRSANLGLALLGPEAPVWYLRLWMSRSGVLSLAEHREWRPKLHEVKAFKDSVEGV